MLKWLFYFFLFSKEKSIGSEKNSEFRFSTDLYVLRVRNHKKHFFYKMSVLFNSFCFTKWKEFIEILHSVILWWEWVLISFWCKLDIRVLLHFFSVFRNSYISRSNAPIVISLLFKLVLVIDWSWFFFDVNWLTGGVDMQNCLRCP